MMSGAPRAPVPRPGFSIAELLVAIGIIAVLGGITVIAVRGIAKDARMSSALNTVSAALDTARGIALRDNQTVAVVFRARWSPDDPGRSQFTEIVTAKWTGESFKPFGLGDAFVVDRFLPINGVQPRALPPGIKVAGPFYDLNRDLFWLTQPELSLTNPQSASQETPSEMIGVMFGPDGQVRTTNPRVAFDVQTFVDFSNGDLDGDGNLQEIGATTGSARFFIHDEPDDEPNINFVPFVAVYDDEEARELKTLNWGNSDNYEEELVGPTGYITAFGRRVHFNRYTGVVMTRSDR